MKLALLLADDQGNTYPVVNDIYGFDLTRSVAQRELAHRVMAAVEAFEAESDTEEEV